MLYSIEVPVRPGVIYTAARDHNDETAAENADAVIFFGGRSGRDFEVHEGKQKENGGRTGFRQGGGKKNIR